LARAGQWIELYSAMSETLVTGALSKRIIRGGMRVFGRALVRPPQDADDFIATMSAALRHDTTALLPTLRVPTLVIGGSADPFFPTPLLRETAALIPDAQLKVYQGAGHGLMKRYKRRFEDDVLAFLAPASAAVAPLHVQA
jgi:pimeloyl-ACP methyl ester carboxylesterase